MQRKTKRLVIVHKQTGSKVVVNNISKAISTGALLHILTYKHWALAQCKLKYLTNNN
jgi:hypothetical protein